MEVDSALREVGGWRRWHATMFVVFGFCVFMPLSWQGLIIVFIGWEPPHSCHIPSAANDSVEFVSIGQCEMRGNLTGQVRECEDGWVYENHDFETIVQKWNLVCKDNFKAELTQLVFQLGGLVALFVIAPLSDRLGRKKMHIATHLLLAVVGVGAAFVDMYYQYLIIRVVLGMLTAVNNSSGVTAYLELFDSKRRTTIAIAAEFFFISNNLILCLMGYLIKNWMTLQIIISAASAVWIILICILPESPLWLASLGRNDEAESVLHRIAQWNGVQIDASRKFLSNCEEKPLALMTSVEVAFVDKRSSVSTETTKVDDFATNLKDCLVFKYLIVGSVLWFSNSVVYYGLYLSTPNMGGNRFLNFSVMCLIEVPAIFIAIFVTRRKHNRSVVSRHVFDHFREDVHHRLFLRRRFLHQGTLSNKFQSHGGRDDASIRVLRKRCRTDGGIFDQIASVLAAERSLRRSLHLRRSMYANPARNGRQADASKHPRSSCPRQS